MGLRLRAALAATLLSGSLFACGEQWPGAASPAAPPGDPTAGRLAMEQYGCGSCHRIPGVAGADGRVGPALEDLASQKVIAGRLPNTPEDLARWVQRPQEVDPGVDMPDLGLSDEEAVNVAAYLLTMR